MRSDASSHLWHLSALSGGGHPAHSPWPEPQRSTPGWFTRRTRRSVACPHLPSGRSDATAWSQGRPGGGVRHPWADWLPSPRQPRYRPVPEGPCGTRLPPANANTGRGARVGGVRASALGLHRCGRPVRVGGAGRLVHCRRLRRQARHPGPPQRQSPGTRTETRPGATWPAGPRNAAPSGPVPVERSPSTPSARRTRKPPDRPTPTSPPSPAAKHPNPAQSRRP